ncbi:MAG: hypothetical protein F6K09_40075, partial [Merismopedia sp. SIO2A8]|nr:hypothetical protein [Merismopedia sp. SIO2A8]
MTLKNFNLLGLVTVAVPVLISCIYSRTVAGEITVSGNCGDLNCEQLLAQLKSNWSEQIKVTTLICWGDKDPNGEIYGTSLGLLPFPGDEENFTSKWNCWNSDE